MNPEFYARAAADARGTLANGADKAAEREAAERLRAAFGVVLHPFAPFSALDWWAEKDGEISAVVEFKNRSHARGDFPTVFLSLRKWQALHFTALGLGTRGIFLVRWTDALGWCAVEETGARLRIGGCGRQRRTRAVSNVEPMVDVPVSAFCIVPPA